jgi:23S rRNA (pseudouridine1915-N3)-methyltransferase
MLNVRVIAVGKLKEKYLADGCAEYYKRLGGLCRLDVIEIPAARLPENPSGLQIQSALGDEAGRILAKTKGSLLVALCIEGDMLDSEQLAGRIQAFAQNGAGALSFVIGSSYGLSEALKAQAALRLSLSRMTFAHQLARLMLAEQLYRALSIGANGKYHK